MQSNVVLEGLRNLVRGAVRRTGWGLTPEEREDAEQDAMLDLYIHLHEKLDPSEATSIDTDAYAGLATRMGRFSAIDLARRKQNPARNAATGRLGPQDDDSLSLDAIVSESVHTGTASSPVDTVLNQMMLDHLREQLKPRERVLLELVGRGYTDSEIAEHYDLPVKTVKWHVQEWKRKCRKILMEYDPERVLAPKRSRRADTQE